MNRTKIKFAETLTGKESLADLQRMKIYMEADDEKEPRINLSIPAFMNTSFLAKIAKTFENSNVDILIDLDEADVKNKGCIFDEKETQAVKVYAEFLNKHVGLGSKISLFDSATNNEYEINEVVHANRMVNDWADKINRATVDGRPLSPLEKYAMAYEMITSFQYKAAETEEGYSKSRGVVDILNGDKIVCAGFTNLLVALCKKIDIPCINLGVNLQGKFDEHGELMHDQDGFTIHGGHAVCLVYIKDDLYGINDIGLSDPTTKSPTNMFLSLDDYKEYVGHRIKAYQNLHFTKEGGHPVDVDDDQLKFILQTDKSMQSLQSEFIKEKKKERKAPEGEEKRRVRVSAMYFLEGFYALCEKQSPKEKRMQFVSQNMQIINLLYGFLDPVRADEFFLRTLDQSIQALMNKKSEKRSVKKFWLDEAVGSRINTELTEDMFIEQKLKTRSLPLRMIEDAFCNVYRSDEFIGKDVAKNPRISALNKLSIPYGEMGNIIKRKSSLDVLAARLRAGNDSSEMLELIGKRREHHEGLFDYYLDNLGRLGEELSKQIELDEEAQQI